MPSENKQFVSNLTRYEILALDGEINVSDGHPRQGPSTRQQAIIDRLPQLFRSSAQESFAQLETRAQRAFLHSIGQYGAPVDEGRVLSCYSSSVAMDVVARSLAEKCSTIGLIHPTFDNIPDLLRGWGHRLVPLEEAELADGRVPTTPELDAVFLTVPNNPTGFHIGPDALLSIAEHCVRRGLVLVLDTCFRGFVSAEREDTYRLLDRTGAQYVVIEDTGKLWPLSELKLGLVAYSENCSLALREHLSDILLTVSPLILALVAEFAEDGREGGYRRLHSLIAANRRALTDALAGTGATVPGPTADVSVSLVELPAHLTARDVWQDLRNAGLHVLPGGHFFWADAPRGDRYIRVALGRDTEVVEKAAGFLRDYLTSAK
ncbi:aminotransferase class I/II-fold pyridoxal phosphate-dependent enzyme [Streptomyces hainanensis]|uniref:Aminotransferase class I/II-fold pyridoxal phosphate-dependent enzyme n=2 Tax=Streptomyces hainanensis TaxID=402648 RepID=A0A4R4TKD0_9ACTN|nr:aminotransferase class I/II-fold pyridoxal phosphate-dependent enzyme [Streptomyces hainanensis]